MTWIEPGDDEWHDKSLNPPRNVDCEWCGHSFSTGEADAKCPECDKKTYLGYEKERR